MMRFSRLDSMTQKLLMPQSAPPLSTHSPIPLPSMTQKCISSKAHTHTHTCQLRHMRVSDGSLPVSETCAPEGMGSVA